ncbi:multiple coagulation factor deficiency protein 2 homolog [Actinia tenebrosa]|uniref:Multiple coagulation factor deficiency protein 2 homolog n=1 Tax=Actinia tenebrosa TaxID=6105 RepID=A0A6P8IYW4_ACTTE|nr:multiple coagulation factor deficiency protein 2 homolog [Actinia tenebrosa]
MFDKRGTDIISLVLFILMLSTTFRSLDCTTTSSAAEESLRSQVKDTEHLAEHLQEHFGMDEAAAKKYLKDNDENAQYFLTHDNNNDSKLDGLEILQALSHHGIGEENANKTQEESDKALVDFVDMILTDQDVNKDGYITYPEFVSYMNKYTNAHGGQQDDQQNKT